MPIGKVTDIIQSWRKTQARAASFAPLVQEDLKLNTLRSLFIFCAFSEKNLKSDLTQKPMASSLHHWGFPLFLLLISTGLPLPLSPNHHFSCLMCSPQKFTWINVIEREGPNSAVCSQWLPWPCGVTHPNKGVQPRFPNQAPPGTELPVNIMNLF